MTPTDRRRCSAVPRFVRTAILVLCAAASMAPHASAQELPTLTGPVNDLANVIPPDVERELDTRIRALLSASGDTVVVATVRTYQPFGSIEDFATKLFARAGIGDRDRDRGLLVLLAVDDRAVRIETGYGIEEIITDGYSGETIRRAMLPAFREGRYGDGLLAGTTRLIQHIADARGVTLANVPRQSDDRGRQAERAIPILPIVIIVFLAISFFRRTLGGPRGPGGRRGWHGGIGPFGGGFGGWGGGFGGGGFGGGFGGFGHGGRSGGGGGGGFGGFGGGMSGGGGASGRW